MRGVHFTILPASPCAAEFYEIWRMRSTHEHDHVCQIFSRSVQGLWSSDTPKIAISYWLAASPLQQCTHCRATLWLSYIIGQKPVFWMPFSQMLTDLDRIWQGSVALNSLADSIW